LRGEIIKGYTRQWQELLSEATTQRGRLTALSDILAEAHDYDMVAQSRASANLDQIKNALDRWMTTYGTSGVSLDGAGKMLARIREQMDAATEEVFEAIGKRQQEVTASTIAETLGELGFVESA